MGGVPDPANPDRPWRIPSVKKRPPTSGGNDDPFASVSVPPPSFSYNALMTTTMTKTTTEFPQSNVVDAEDLEDLSTRPWLPIKG